MSLHHSKDPNQLFREIEQFKRDIPRIAGNEAVNFFKTSFRKQGWHDGVIKPWVRRKRVGNRPTDNRAILVKSGVLKKSIRIDRYTNQGVIISSEMPYSRIHNEGGKINTNATVRPHARRTKNGRTNVRRHSRQMSTTIPQRKFMGQSTTLDNIIINSLERRLRQIIS